MGQCSKWSTCVCCFFLFAENMRLLLVREWYNLLERWKYNNFDDIRSVRTIFTMYNLLCISLFNFSTPKILSVFVLCSVLLEYRSTSPLNITISDIRITFYILDITGVHISVSVPCSVFVLVSVFHSLTLLGPFEILFLGILCRWQCCDRASGNSYFWLIWKG